jgi:hypothetical protein
LITAAVRKGLIVALLPAAAAIAGDLQWWNDVEFSLADAGRVEWGAEVGLRTREQVGELYDRRASMFVDVELYDGISVSGGYMISNRIISGFGFDWNSRIVGQVNYKILRFGTMDLEGVTAYERQMGRPDRPDYNRYRQRFEANSGKRGFSPWVYQDFTFLRQGFYRSRSRLGIRWRSHRGYAIGVAYQFEAIHNTATSVTRPRHTVFAALDIERPLWKSLR